MERSQHAVKQHQASDFTQRLNATLRSVQVAGAAPTSHLIDIDWSRNVMITVSVSVEDDMVAASAGGLTNCSACTFAHMCEAADNPGDCHWCELSRGKSYCEVNGTACRSAAKPQRTTRATRRDTLGVRLGAAVRAAAARGSPGLELTFDEMPIFVNEIDTVSPRNGATGQTIFTFRLTNERQLTVEEHPWWRYLPVALKEAGLPHPRTYF